MNDQEHRDESMDVDPMFVGQVLEQVRTGRVHVGQRAAAVR